MYFWNIVVILISIESSVPNGCICVFDFFQSINILQIMPFYVWNSSIIVDGPMMNLTINLVQFFI